MNIGIDFGGTTISAGIIDSGKILCRDTISTKSQRKYNEILKDIISLVNKLSKSSYIFM